MYRRRKQRNIIILSLTFVLLLMSVGYAAFRTNLKIKGTTRITSLWDVRITNVTSGTPTGSAQNKITPTWSNLTATMEVDLYEKGDAMEYDVTITNNGTIDAVLSDVVGTPSNSNAVLISYTGFTKGEKLYKKGHSGDTKIVHVKIEYNPAYEGGETSGQSTIEFNYTQGEGGDIQPVENAHVLTYNFAENGGSTSTATNAYIVKNTQIDLTPTATKPGYEFVGWNTNKDAQTGLATLSMGDNDITLYAIFKKVYTITYEKSENVQSIGKQSDTCTVYNKATTCSVTLPTITPKTGYSADTWYNGTTAVGHAGDNYTVAGSVNLIVRDTVNELVFNDQTIAKQYGSEVQTINITPATNGTGSYTYSKKSEKNEQGTNTNYMSISGTTITIAENIPVGTYTFVITASDINSGATKDAIYTITLTDETLPEVSDIEGGTALKSTSQNLTLKATDNVGVSAYYWGTTEPTAASAITTTTSADLTSIEGSGLTKNVTQEGTYWFAVKDAAGNFSKKSIVIRKYQVQNVLETIAASSNTIYTNANYAALNDTKTYYVKDGTTLTLTSSYTKPTGGGAFKGYTTSAPSATAQTPSTTNPTVATNNTTVYYMWFTRLTYNVTVTQPTNGTVKAETVTQTGNSVTASTAAAILTVKYDDTVKATATASTGYTFTGWSGGYVSGTTNPVTGAAVTEAKTITAAFTGNTYTATFYYNSNTTSGSTTISSKTEQCTVISGSNCSITIPTEVTGSGGTYNNKYVGLSNTTGNMTKVTDSETTVTLTANTDYYSLYRTNVVIYYPSSTSVTANKTVYQNQWFSSKTALAGTVLSTTNVGTTTNATAATAVSDYTTLVGFNASASQNTATYSTIAALTQMDSGRNASKSVYEIDKKTESIEATFYYSNSSEGEKTNSKASGTRTTFLRPTSTNAAGTSVSNSSITAPSTTAPYGTILIGWSTGASSMSGATVNTANTSYYAFYGANVTNYYYGSSYTNRTLYRNGYYGTNTNYTMVLSTTNTGTSNYSTAVGPGSSAWYGLSTAKDTTREYTSVGTYNTGAAYSTNTSFYTIYQFNITYAKGSGVSSIGSTTDACYVTTSSTSCTITTPTITPNTGYVSVGWNTTSGAATGTNAGSNYTVTTNATKLYANAVGTPTFTSTKNVVTITYPSGCASPYTCQYSIDDGTTWSNSTTSTKDVTLSKAGFVIARVTDGTNSITSSTYTFAPKAENLSYDNSNTNLPCTDAQCAIDKLKEMLD